jgi:hypothetical protein
MYYLNNIYSPQYFRLFLIEMGFLDAQQKNKLKSLETSDELLKGLKILDQLPEYLIFKCRRAVFSVSVLYCGSGQQTFNEIFNNDYGSAEFEQFLWSLGWPVNVESHTGYKGRLTSSISEIAPYFADLYCEVIYHVPIHFRPETQNLRHSPMFLSYSQNSLNSAHITNDGSFANMEEPCKPNEIFNFPDKHEKRRVISF